MEESEGKVLERKGERSCVGSEREKFEERTLRENRRSFRHKERETVREAKRF